MVLVPKSKPPEKPQHKKRTGQHHRPSKHYAKTYWPYLPLLVIVGIGLLANTVWAGLSRGVLGASTGISASTLLDATNTQRVEASKADLQLNSQLSRAAQAKAEDMAARDYWSHTAPDGQQPWSFITDSGYKYQIAGENLAYGFVNSTDTVRGWMNSPEHRANLLHNSYRDVGFGVAHVSNYQGKGETTIVVAMYAEPAASAVLANQADNTVSASVPQHIARVQLLTTAGATWSLVVVIASAAFAAGIFIARHTLMLRRALVYSEVFVAKHHLLDIVFVSVAMLGYVLSRTAGFIQ